MRIDWLRVTAVLVTIAGLAVTIALLVHVGVGDVLAVVERIGIAGFVGYCAITLVILCVLGTSHALLAGLPDQLPTFIWSRATREAATDVLPFSQFGGIVVGARSLVARGIRQSLVYASLVADQTSELAAQLVYTVYGVGALLLVLRHAATGQALMGPALLGLGASTAIIIAFAVAQRPLLAFAARIAAAILPAASAGLATMPDELAAIYRRRRPLVASFLLHLVAWIGAGAGAWVALVLIGAAIPLQSVIIIEGVIFTIRTAAFLVPGAVGLQEGAYVLIGPLFGLPAEAALALSLLKRGRDLAIGVPVMIAWQIAEGRGAVRAGG